MIKLFGYMGWLESGKLSLIFIIFPVIWFIIALIYGETFTINQLIASIIIIPIGVFVLMGILGLLDDLYSNSGTSIFAFIIEYTAYGIFLGFISDYIFNFLLYEN